VVGGTMAIRDALYQNLVDDLKIFKTV
jgi:hypothetical protein